MRDRIVKNPRIIKREILQFYKNLYSQADVPRIRLPRGFLPQINEEQAVVLERIPTKEEIKRAVFMCDSSKAVGYDGYNLNFIKKF